MTTPTTLWFLILPLLFLPHPPLTVELTSVEPAASEPLPEEATLPEAPASPRAEQEESAPPQRGGPPRGSGPLRRPGGRPVSEQPILASDGEEIAPGRVPADTSEAARALWRRAESAMRAADVAPPQLSSFDLTFDVDARHESGKNDFTVNVRFLEEHGYLRSQMAESRRIQLRGPDGDWLVDKDELIDLTTGRQNREDRQQMDQWITIARNFTNLASPSALRIVALRESQAPAGLPDEVKGLVPGLVWLEVESPDFNLYPLEAGKPIPVMRARLGLDASKDELALCLLEDRNPRMARHAQLIRYLDWQPVDGYSLPTQMLIYMVKSTGSQRMFFARPTYDLYVHKGARLNLELEESTFRPK